MKKLLQLSILFLGLTISAQDIVSVETTQEGNLIIKKTTYEDGTEQYNLRSDEPITTDITGFLLGQSACSEEFSGGCPVIILGCCQDGVDSSTNGGVCNHPEFQHYTCSTTLELQFDNLRVEHAWLEFILGASLVDNGILIFESTSCDVGDELTRISFSGGGDRFPDLETMNQTLGIKTPLKIYDLPLGEKYQVIAMTGQILSKGIVTENTRTDLKMFSGLNLLKIENYIPLKIIN